MNTENNGLKRIEFNNWRIEPECPGDKTSDNFIFYKYSTQNLSSVEKIYVTEIVRITPSTVELINAFLNSRYVKLMMSDKHENRLLHKSIDPISGITNDGKYMVTIERNDVDTSTNNPIIISIKDLHNTDNHDILLKDDIRILYSIFTMLSECIYTKYPNQNKQRKQEFFIKTSIKSI